MGLSERCPPLWSLYLVLEYLTPLQKRDLLTLNKSTYHHLLSIHTECRHMKQALMITYGCWTPGFQRVTSFQNWLHFLVMLENNCDKTSSELSFEDWKWQRRSDTVLDCLLQQWRSLCPELATDLYHGGWVEDIALYDLVHGSMEGFIERAESVSMSDFTTAIPIRRRLSQIPVKDFMRFIKFTNPHKWPAIPDWHFVREPPTPFIDDAAPFSGMQDRFLSPIVTRVCFEEPSLLYKMVALKPERVFQLIQRFNPYNPATHTWCEHNIMEMIQARPKVLDLTPKHFWTQPLPTGKHLSVTPPDLILRGVRCAQGLESHIIAQIQEHLEKLRLTPLQSDRTFGLYCEGEGPMGIIELSFSRQETELNLSVNHTDNVGSVAVMSLGSNSAVLYKCRNYVTDDDASSLDELDEAMFLEDDDYWMMDQSWESSSTDWDDSEDTGDDY
eukprot:Blabericola_migrator_1__2897@NODE_1832_length_3721_cov_121_168309_g1174_i0_p1_GENE_NODE_1832_length_3721_cov_121_168309_g1174_i0NODE_1832_length_3721_cov_121_168309_g1174_i0_p1_ORF_typecomplete_len443_score79_16_NODE_1832_length_3721_cov_121_168309_g1174_i014422770